MFKRRLQFAFKNVKAITNPNSVIPATTSLVNSKYNSNPLRATQILVDIRPSDAHLKQPAHNKRSGIGIQYANTKPNLVSISTVNNNLIDASPAERRIHNASQEPSPLCRTKNPELTKHHPRSKTLSSCAANAAAPRLPRRHN